MEKTITIGGVQTKLKCSAATPRLYRILFAREWFDDVVTVSKADVESTTRAEILENMAFTMAKQADPELASDINEWLDQFGSLGIYTACNEILAMNAENAKTTSSAKKKTVR